MRAIDIKVYPRRGQTIRQACDDAKMLSEFIKEEIEFSFNGVTITTDNQSINEMVDSYTKQR